MLGCTSLCFKLTLVLGLLRLLLFDCSLALCLSLRTCSSNGLFALFLRQHLSFLSKLSLSSLLGSSLSLLSLLSAFLCSSYSSGVGSSSSCPLSTHPGGMISSSSGFLCSTNSSILCFASASCGSSPTCSSLLLKTRLVLSSNRSLSFPGSGLLFG